MITSKFKTVWKKQYTIALIAAIIVVVVFLFADRFIARHMDGTDAFRKMFYLLSALNAAMIAGAFFLLKIKKVRLEYVFLLTAAVLGISFSLLIPPVAAPDESYHLGFVYAEAEKLRGWDTNEYFEDGSVGTQFLRRIESEHGLSQDGINHDYYAALYPRLSEKETTDELVELKYSNNHEVPHFVYVPAALGINLGRMLHLGAVPTFFLGRFLNLLIFLTAGFYSIRRMPFGKELLFAVMLLPMTIQEVNSFSCDSMILSLSVLVISLTMHLAYDPVSLRVRDGKRAGKVDPVVVTDLVLLFFSTFLLSQCKYGALMPMALFPLLILLRKRKNDRILAILAGSVTLADLLAGFLPCIYRTFHSVVLVNTAAPNYAAGFLFTHPKTVFLLIGNTIHRYLDHYVFSTIGTSLGWYQLNIPLHIGILFLAVLFFLLPRGSEDRRMEGKAEKLLVGMICFLGVMTAVGGMLIGNTPATSMEIIGVQGRYFLPFLCPFLLLLIPKRIRITGNADDHMRTVLLFALVLEFTAIMCLFIRAF